MKQAKRKRASMIVTNLGDLMKAAGFDNTGLSMPRKWSRDETYE
jgi:hypothetical protein